MNSPKMWEESDNNVDDTSSAFGIGMSQEEIHQTLAKAELSAEVQSVALFSKGPLIILGLAALLCFAAAVIIHLCSAHITREFNINFFYIALLISSVIIPLVAMRFVFQKAVIVFLR